MSWACTFTPRVPFHVYRLVQQVPGLHKHCQRQAAKKPPVLSPKIVPLWPDCPDKWRGQAQIKLGAPRRPDSETAKFRQLFPDLAGDDDALRSWRRNQRRLERMLFNGITFRVRLATKHLRKFLDLVGPDNPAHPLLKSVVHEAEANDGWVCHETWQVWGEGRWYCFPWPSLASLDRDSRAVAVYGLPIVDILNILEVLISLVDTL